jgi:KDO2-lipid IV(A) lauroyltransferase
MNQDPKLKLFIDYFVYILVRLFEITVNILPESFAAAFGRFAGRLSYIMLSDRRKAAIENLTIAFKDKDAKWIRSIARKNFEHIGLLVIEFFQIRHWSQDKIIARIEIEGKENLSLSMYPGQGGVLLLKSHFGCFEVSAATVKFQRLRMHLLMTPLKNPFVSRYLFSRGSNDGLTTWPHKGVIRELIPRLRDGATLAVLADQRGDAERGVFVNFFGTPAPANEVFAKLAIEGNTRILPFYTYRTGLGRYKSVFEKEILFEPSSDYKHDLITLSQLFHDRFEEWIRIAPEQGFWVHRKWKRASSRKRRKKSARRS